LAQLITQYIRANKLHKKRKKKKKKEKEKENREYKVK
jgi:hypothetical protein